MIRTDCTMLWVELLVKGSKLPIFGGICLDKQVFSVKCQPVTINSNPIDFFHNPRCQKSREALQILEDAGRSPRIMLYLDTPLTVQDLKSVLKKLGISAFDLVRKDESLYKEKFKGKLFSEDEWVKVMVENPKLIQRPIAIMDDKAVIGRPPERVLELIK